MVRKGSGGPGPGRIAWNLLPRGDMRRYICVAGVLLAACGGSARVPLERQIGPSPELPAPRTSPIPVVKVAKAVHWRAGETPTAAAGLAVNAFAQGLDHPRWLYVLPNGDVLVAETNAPGDREKKKGIRAYFMNQFFAKAGAAVPSANRITLLRDADADGVAELRSVLLDSLYSPFGMSLVGDTLYIANADAVVAVPYRDGATTIDARPRHVAGLPGGTINHHWTKSMIASADGSRLYVGVGSNSNVAERGLPAERDRAAILEVDPRLGTFRVYADGLRNPVGLAWEPQTGALWTSVNERDELGSDLVPDYITAVQPGGFYGWPFVYYGNHVDRRVKATTTRAALVPDYALGPHTGSLGLASSAGTTLPAAYRDGMFVGQHGSWNRKPLAGYRVIFVPFANGKPTGAQPIIVLSDFLDADGHARGRPVGVTIDRRGALLVADDVGNTIWRVTAAR
jgi:glucose/arabinose dehydrogenase